MLEIVIISLFTFFLIWILRKLIERRITKSESAKESVKIRKLYKGIRIVLLVLYIIVMVPVVCLFVKAVFSSLSSSALIMNRFFILIGGIAFAIYPITAMSLPISGMTIDQFDEKEYYLFLRGFSSDNYNPSMMEEVEQGYYRLHTLGAYKKTRNQEAEAEKKPFSELAFSSAVKAIMPIYSVGMPKEVESPDGSERVYLDDETWQRDVSALVEKANYVFILVHNSKSCVWEIQECQKIANEKTVYFVDDPNTLKEYCNSNPEGIPAELKYLMDNDLSMRHTMVCRKNGVVKAFHYKNTEDGFKKALNVLFNDEDWNFQEENEKAQREKERAEKEKAEKERKKNERIERRRLKKERRKRQAVTSKHKWLLWAIVSAVVVLASVLLIVFALPNEVNLEGSGSYNGHEYVDLGLPSGTLWATCNVGATTPEGYGDYYAWGETSKKDGYDSDTYKHKDHRGFYNKYVIESYYGNVDSLTILQPIDDAANTYWGECWSMPSDSQWKELQQYTQKKWVKHNGVRGLLFTANNGRNIFLPAAGDSHFPKDNSIGHYWSSSLDYFYDSSRATCFEFASKRCKELQMGWVRSECRIYGLSVRPVVHSN